MKDSGDVTNINILVQQMTRDICNAYTVNFIF